MCIPKHAVREHMLCCALNKWRSSHGQIVTYQAWSRVRCTLLMVDSKLNGMAMTEQLGVRTCAQRRPQNST